MIYLDVTKGLNHIGRLGENEHRTLRFRESAEILTLYPEAVVTVLHKRPGDLAAYPVAAEYVDVSSGMVCWTIQSGDLARVGRGKVELVFYEGDVIAKSYIYDTFVEQALNGSEEAPDPWRTWIDRIEKGTDERIEAVEENIAGKAEATDTVLQTTLSRGRKENSAVGEGSIAFGENAEASGKYSVSLGYGNIASGSDTIAQGIRNNVSGNFSTAFGADNTVAGHTSFTNGNNNIVNGPNSGAIGAQCKANLQHMFVCGFSNDPAEMFPLWEPGAHYNVGDIVIEDDTDKTPRICREENSDQTLDYRKWRAYNFQGKQVFIVGGSGNLFEVQHDGTAKAKTALQIGNTKITEAQLQALLALLS